MTTADDGSALEMAGRRIAESIFDGVEIADAFGRAADGCEDSRIARSLRAVRVELGNGAQLCAALQRESESLDSEFVRFVQTCAAGRR